MPAEAFWPQRAAAQDLDVVVMGRAGMDLYPLPDGTKTADAASFRSDLGGSSGNIAVALARHGLAVGLAAPVSADPAGAFVKNRLADYGVEHLTPRPVGGSARTSLAIAETVAEGTEVVIYRNDAADFQITDETFDPAAVDRAPVLIVTGTALALEPSRSACLAAMARSAFALLDLDYRPYSWVSAEDARATFAAACALSQGVVGNDEEFDFIAPEGTSGLDHARALAAATAFTVYKQGAAGSQTFAAEQAFETPIFPVTMLKPFGAGDAFMGGLVAALTRGERLARAVEIGSAAAAMVVARPGCASAMPLTAEVETFIQQHGR